MKSFLVFIIAFSASLSVHAQPEQVKLKKGQSVVVCEKDDKKAFLGVKIDGLSKLNLKLMEDVIEVRSEERYGYGYTSILMEAPFATSAPSIITDDMGISTYCVTLTKL